MQSTIYIGNYTIPDVARNPPFAPAPLPPLPWHPQPFSTSSQIPSPSPQRLPASFQLPLPFALLQSASLQPPSHAGSSPPHPHCPLHLHSFPTQHRPLPCPTHVETTPRMHLLVLQKPRSHPDRHAACPFVGQSACYHISAVQLERKDGGRGCLEAARDHAWHVGGATSREIPASR